MPTPVIFICATMLFMGAAPLPYGYYTLLRLTAFGVFAYAAFVAYERKRPILPWTYALLALVFNPIIKIHLPKEVWAIVDIAAGLFLLATAKFLKIQKSDTSNKKKICSQ